MRNTLKAVLVIIGTLIGAGFASGQEIYSFFNVYRENGIIGIILSGLITGFVIYKVLKKSNNSSNKAYNDLFSSTQKFKRLKHIINLIINIFLLLSFYIMVAGFSAYFKQEFNIPNILTSIIVLVLCYITFMKNIEGIAKINSIIVPILIIIILIIGFRANVLEIFNNIELSNIQFSGNWIIKSIEYASYNTILLIPILISLKEYTKNNEKSISLITTLIFLILAITIYLLMFNYTNISNIEIPIVYIASMYGNIFKYIYGVVIIFAIYTTMISAGYGFLENCTKSKKSYKFLAMLICMSGILISNLSFSNLVNLTYPVFGILGLIQFIYIIC